MCKNVNKDIMLGAFLFLTNLQQQMFNLSRGGRESKIGKWRGGEGQESFGFQISFSIFYETKPFLT